MSMLHGPRRSLLTNTPSGRVNIPVPQFGGISGEGLIYWLDAREGLFEDVDGTIPVTANNQYVSRWNDLSPNGNNFVCEVLLPEWTPSHVNSVLFKGQSAVSFDPDVMGTLANENLQLPVGDRTFVFTYCGLDDDAPGEQYLFSSSSTLCAHIHHKEGSPQTVAYDTVTWRGQLNPTNSPQVLMWVISNTTLDVYRDGILVDGGLTWNTTSIAANSVSIGGTYSSFGGPSDFVLDGLIAQTALYNRAITFAEIETLAEHLLNEFIVA